jgi:hypothetical protein
MDYAKIPQPKDGTAEVREPAVAYAVGGWAADVSDGLDELDKEIAAGPDGRHLGEWRYDNDPAFREFVRRRFYETEARIAAGEQGYTTDEVREKLEWRIKNNQWDDVRERMRRNG